MMEIIKNKRKNVLLVEDDKINQKLISNLLKNINCDVIVASSGEEAIKIWTSQALDMILMDLHLPQIDGIEATKTIRMLEKQKNTYTPIIALTASEKQEIKDRCVEVGMNGYIVKPIDMNKFYKTINEISNEDEYILPFINIEDALEDLEGDKELLKELIEDFIGEEYSVNLLKSIRDAVNIKDFKNLYKKAHKLKGAAACIHINSVYDVAYKLEEKGRNNDNIGLEELVDTLEKEYEIIRHFFSNYKWADSL